MPQVRRPITILWRNDDGDWEDFLETRAYINKNTKGSESFTAGADSMRSSLTFDTRYNSKVAKIEEDTQHYRIRYRGMVYDVISYDDYQELHIDVRLVGALIGS